MLKKLKFHLVVHSPFRPVEGLIIDLKVLFILMKIYNAFHMFEVAILHCV